MNPEQSIPEELVPKVLEKASRLYQKQTGQTQDNYSLAELMVAGSEVSLPPELIQQAYAQIQQEQRAEIRRRAQRKQQVKIGGAIAAASILLTTLWTVSVYNSLNASKNTVAGKWAQVDNQMQRRANLIPQLTQVTESYAGQERAVIEALKTAREAFLTATTAEERMAANEEMKTAIANFQSLTTSSQQLQSSELFINLQYEIAGTENRIATERMRYNQAVESYNREISSFPKSIVAGPLGFQAGTF